MPYIGAAGELKTKPTQHSVKELRAIGIQPDILLCRAEKPIPEDERRKIAQFCNVYPERVIPALDFATIYEAPIAYHHQGFDTQVLKVFGMADAPMPDLSRWNRVVDHVRNPEGEVRIAVVGKYMQVKDSYKSLSEALTHGGIANNVRVRMDWIDSEIFERDDAASSSRASTASWCPAASASAASRARSPRSSSRASGACRSSASATGCTWR